MPDINGGEYKLDLTALYAGLDKAQASAASFERQLIDSATTTTGRLAAAAQAQVQFSDKVAQGRAELAGIAAAARDVSAEIRALAERSRELERAIKRANNADESKKWTAELEKNNTRLKEARFNVDELKKATEQERAAVAAVAEARRLEANQTKLAAAAAKDAAQAAKETKDSLAGKVGTFFGGLLGQVVGAGAGLFAFSALLDKAKQGIDDFASLSGVQATFRAVAGDANEGGKAFVFVKEQANALGLELIPTAKAYAQLFAAAKEANLPIAETENIFKGITSAGKVLNISQAETEQALKAVQQMLSKGTVSSEELRRQLGNALPGAFGIAAKAAGLTTQEFGKQLAQGNILANEFLPKFARQLQQTYGAGTEEASQNVRANLGRINTYFQESSAKIGALLAPAIALFADFVGAGKTAAQQSDSLVASYTKQNTGLVELRQTVTPLVARYDELSRAGSLNIGQQKELDSVIQQLAKTVPGAVTQFDAYGKALGINSAAVKQFVKDQENLVRYNNRDRLKENRAALIELNKEQEKLTNQLNDPTSLTVNGLTRRTRGVAGTGYRETLSQAESDRITNLLTTQLSKVQDDIRANLANRQLLRGKSPLLPTGDPAANDKAAQALIEKQEKLIADLKARQRAATTTERKGKEGFDYLLGAGGLDEQLDKANKELDRLLGKVEKARKTRQLSYESQLRALLAERATLAQLAEKAAIRTADDAGTQALASFKFQLAQVEAIKAKLEQRERDLAKQALKVGGTRAVGRLGELADGRVDGQQEKALTQLRLAALDAYYTELYRITVEREQRLFDLRAEDDTKEVEAVNRKYDRLIKASTDGIERQAIEDARQREQVALRQKQEQARIDRTAALSSAIATTAGETYDTGTGISVIEAKRAEKRALLEIERKHAEDTLNNTLLLGTKEGELQRAQAQATLARIRNQLREIEQEKAKTKATDSIYKLLFGENDSDELRNQFEQTANQVIGTINQVLAAQLAAEQLKIQAHNQNIGSLQGQLAAEIQLNREGSASNIKGILEQLAAEKKAKAESLAESRRIAKQQQLINDLQVISSLSVAVANIIAGWSTVPIAGSILGLVAAAATVAGFVAQKSAATSAAKAGGDSFFVGGYTGDGNERETSTAIGPRPYEYHRREFVMPHDLTDRYRRSLFEPLHQGKPLRWDDPVLQSLLPDRALPNQLRVEQQATQQHRVEHSFAPMKRDFNRLHDRLQAIEATNASMAGRPDAIPTPDGYLLTFPNGSTQRVRFVS